MKAALPEDVRTAAEPAAAAGTEQIARRFLVHLGAGATPERTATRAVAASGERALAVQFRVSDAVFEQATAHFGTARVFRDLRVVPAFPTVAEAGWVVVSAPAVPGAPRRGDRIVAIGAVTLAPTDLPSAVTAADAELHVARGDQTLAMRWLP